MLFGGGEPKLYDDTENVISGLGTNGGIWATIYPQKGCSAPSPLSVYPQMGANQRSEGWGREEGREGGPGRGASGPRWSAVAPVSRRSTRSIHWTGSPGPTAPHPKATQNDRRADGRRGKPPPHPPGGGGRAPRPLDPRGTAVCVAGVIEEPLEQFCPILGQPPGGGAVPAVRESSSMRSTSTPVAPATPGHEH